MDSLISRQAAIDLLRKRLIETANNNVGFTCDAGQVFEDASERIRDWIDELPSAQPTTNCSEIPNTSDFVSRKAVREMVATWSYDMAEWEDVELALSDVDKLLSVHPEVIHCKDCALWHRTGCPMNIFVKKPEPGYFCGTAKRKESQCGYERQDVQTEENMQLTDLREEQEERIVASPIMHPLKGE